MNVFIALKGTQFWFLYGIRQQPPHDKTNKITVRPAKTQISLGNRPVWSESSLCAQWVAKDPSFLHAQPHCWFCHEAAHFIIKRDFQSFLAPLCWKQLSQLADSCFGQELMLFCKKIKKTWFWNIRSFFWTWQLLKGLWTKTDEIWHIESLIYWLEYCITYFLGFFVLMFWTSFDLKDWTKYTGF